MNKQILYTLLIVSLALGSCKKYLDKEPDNRTSITTPDQVSQLLTTAYPKGNYILFCESMSDNAEDKAGGGTGLDFADKINRESYRFEVVQVSPEDIDGPDYYWNTCYKAIAAANQALEIITNTEDSSGLMPHKGEALLARAYAHFMLVTLFSKAYDPATASSDPGIPYVTVPEKVTFKNYERKTVAFVYEMIEKDLTEGYPLINDNIYGNAPRFHFNKRAAAAFAARFYLFKQDYQKVIDFADLTLGSSELENLRPWNSSLTQLQYLELQAEYTKATTKGNLLLQETNSIWGRSFPVVRYGLGDQVANTLFFRENVSGNVYAYDIYGSSQVYNIPKFYEFFVRESLNANSGQPYNTIPLLTGEETLLNRAEAYVRTGNSNNAIADMNTFLSQNLDDYNAASDKVSPSKVSNYYGVPASSAMIMAILDFKRAFFVHEGMRWFDIVRLKIPVVHTTSEGEVIEIQGDDLRKVLQLPALTKQAGLEPNPR